MYREYSRQKAPIKAGSIKPGTASQGIMSKARERRDISKAKANLADIINNNNVDKLDDLKTQLQAAIYRLSNPDPAAEDGEAGNGTLAAVELSTLAVNFDEGLGKERPGKKMVRYQMNPRADWGPMNKASG